MTERRDDGAFGDIRPHIQHNLAVVLVDPGDARNIGAVARAMSNLGVSDLRLVLSRDFDRELARAVACWGDDLIDKSRSYETLAAAVSDRHEVVGFASDSSSHRVSQMVLEDWVSSLGDSNDRTIALVFGSEENGLLKEHFPLCQYLVRIPSSGANRSYNLAQSVLLALYEICTKGKRYVGGQQLELPTSSQLSSFSSMVLRVAGEVGFLNENSPSHMEELLTNITRRGRLTSRELKVMTGLFGMIQKRLKSA
jgi:TrmH family RNA methyltransferase